MRGRESMLGMEEEGGRRGCEVEGVCRGGTGERVG